MRDARHTGPRLPCWRNIRTAAINHRGTGQDKTKRSREGSSARINVRAAAGFFAATQLRLFAALHPLEACGFVGFLWRVFMRSQRSAIAPVPCIVAQKTLRIASPGRERNDLRTGAFADRNGHQTGGRNAPRVSRGQQKNRLVWDRGDLLGSLDTRRHILRPARGPAKANGFPDTDGIVLHGEPR